VNSICAIGSGFSQTQFFIWNLRRSKSISQPTPGYKAKDSKRLKNADQLLVEKEVSVIVWACRSVCLALV
jgi:hypothetical protein